MFICHMAPRVLPAVVVKTEQKSSLMLFLWIKSLTDHLEDLDLREETPLGTAGMNALCGKSGIPLMSTRTVNTAECAAPHTIVRRGRDP